MIHLNLFFKTELFRLGQEEIEVLIVGKNLFIKLEINLSLCNRKKRMFSYKKYFFKNAFVIRYKNRSKKKFCLN